MNSITENRANELQGNIEADDKISKNFLNKKVQKNQEETDASVETIKKINPTDTDRNFYKPKKVYRTRLEMCEVLHITLPTLWKLMKNGSIPYFRAGRRVLFDEESVQNKLQDNQKKMNLSNK